MGAGSARTRSPFLVLRWSSVKVGQARAVLFRPPSISEQARGFGLYLIKAAERRGDCGPGISAANALESLFLA